MGRLNSSEKTLYMQNYSVALASYNGERYIKEQLESILNQSVPPFEIIISDDGSSDSTNHIVNSFLGDRGFQNFKFIKNELKPGVIGNFTNAISNCTSDIIFTSDQDDIWHPDKAKFILSKFDENQDALMIFTNGYIVDEYLNKKNGSMWDAIKIPHTDCIRGKQLFNILIKRCVVTGATMAIKKDLFEMANPIPEEWLHDGWFAWIAVINNGLFGFDKKLIYYRQHSSNVVGMNAKGSLLKRIKSWYRCIDELEELRIIRYNRYKRILDLNEKKLTGTQRKEIRNCLNFWQTLIELKDKTAIKKFSLMTHLYIMGWYNKYFNGIRGYVRDIISILQN